MDNGQFKQGNQFWKARSKHGKDKLFETPESLWDAACEYFQWCEDNPLYEAKIFSFQGVQTMEQLPKMRAMTLSGLCLFLKCNESYFRSFKIQERENKADYITVIEDIENTIYNQKFSGAAADLLNANIISRELGLADKKETDITLKEGSISPEKWLIQNSEPIKSE